MAGSSLSARASRASIHSRAALMQSLTRLGLVALLGQFGGCRPHDVFEVDGQAGKVVHRPRQERVGAGRRQSDAEDLGAVRRRFNDHDAATAARRRTSSDRPTRRDLRRRCSARQDER